MQSRTRRRLVGALAAAALMIGGPALAQGPDDPNDPVWPGCEDLEGEARGECNNMMAEAHAEEVQRFTDCIAEKAGSPPEGGHGDDFDPRGECRDENDGVDPTDEGGFEDPGGPGGRGNGNG